MNHQRAVILILTATDSLRLVRACEPYGAEGEHPERVRSTVEVISDIIQKPGGPD